MQRLRHSANVEWEPRRRYLFAAGVLVVVAVIAFAGLAMQLENQRTKASFIDTAGRQRMLTERAAALAEQGVYDRAAKPRSLLRVRLLETVAELEARQAALSGEGASRPPRWLPASVRRIDFEEPYVLNWRTRQFVATARSLTKAGLRDFIELHTVLVSTYDRAFNAYVVESERSQRAIVGTELAAFALFLIILVIEVCGIFRPMKLEILGKQRELQIEIARAREARTSFEESDRRLRLLVDQMPVILWAVDTKLTFTYCTGSGLAELGFTASEIMGTSALTRDWGKSGFIKRLRASLLGESSSSETMTLLGRKYRSQLQPWRDSDGRIVGVIGVAFDVTELANMTNALKEGEAALARTERVAQIGSWSVDLRTREVAWSNELYRLCGVTSCARPPGRKAFEQFVHPGDAAAIRAALRTAYRTREPYTIDRRLVQNDGSVRWVQQQGSFVFQGGAPRRIIGMIFDVTERKATEERVRFQANHDELTRLPNREQFVVRITELLGTSSARRPSIGLIVLDVDRFKTVYDSFGHAAGDEFIRAVAARIVRCAPAGSAAARIASDEFAIALDASADAASLAMVARKLVAAFGLPFNIGDTEIVTSISIGTSFGTAETVRAEELLRNADAAMSQAKRAGRGFIRPYTESLRVSQVERMTLDFELRRAHENEDLQLFYQPIVSDRGTTVGLEALMRWQHPTRGMISPDRFIPIAEESGLIVSIGAWALERACSDVRALHCNGFESLKLAVNISGRQIEDPEFATTVEAILERTNFDARLLELEITESIIMSDVEAVQKLLLRFKAMGVRISIDDFGTGYSSLAYLKRLPVDTLKIDKSFVHDLDPDHLDGAIARTIVTLAHSLRLEVIAEGVETEVQLAFLKRIKCDQMQGFLFSRPVAIWAIDEMLHRDRAFPIGGSPALHSIMPFKTGC